MATEVTGIRRAIRGRGNGAAFLRVTGVGKRRTQTSVAALAAESPTAIVMVGFCGACSPQLRTGDLHVAQAFRAGGPSVPIAADQMLTETIATWASWNNHSLAVGPSMTVDGIATPSEKASIHAATGAMSVNMEDYWAAKAASDYGIPFASVRAVLDGVDDELPDFLGNMGDGMLDALRGMASHPGGVPSLIRLGGKARVARRSLTGCVKGVLEFPSTRPAATARLVP